VNVLSLFTGVGGLDLGLQRAGMTIIGQVEIDPWCRDVLRVHFPEVPQHDDARTAVRWWRGEARPPVHVVAGGPPCQPFSQAGRRRGVADERWQWPAMAHTVRELRPRYVVLENVANLPADRTAFGWILADLAGLGFDAEWSLLSACAVGAPHVRRRLLLVAYADVQHGSARLGTYGTRDRTAVESFHASAGAWRDHVARSVATSRADDRDSDGSARKMVEHGGNAVVPQVAELIGRMIVQRDRRVRA
jgi:DNA (cytosine-5)-methyltransferase 1